MLGTSCVSRTLYLACACGGIAICLSRHFRSMSSRLGFLTLHECTSPAILGGLGMDTSQVWTPSVLGWPCRPPSQLEAPLSSGWSLIHGSCRKATVVGDDALACTRSGLLPRRAQLGSPQQWRAVVRQCLRLCRPPQRYTPVAAHILNTAVTCQRLSSSLPSAAPDVALRADPSG